MSRFNLWEKFLTEGEDTEEIEDTIEDELEGEIEDEKDETTYDMLVNFVLGLPEDAVPEDLKSTYDSLMAKIGDEYLGGDEDLEDPKFEESEEESEEISDEE